MEMNDMNDVRTFNGKVYDSEHGSCFDRGSADSYYHRDRKPHKYPNGTYNGDAVVELTIEEVEAYNAGYDFNEQYGDKKDWG
jgi:hypothetical protein